MIPLLDLILERAFRDPQAPGDDVCSSKAVASVRFDIGSMRSGYE
jgi:hypothetical protein